MKKVIRQALREIAIKNLVDFSYEKDKSFAQVESYAEALCNDFSKYLKAYNEFKED